MNAEGYFWLFLARTRLPVRRQMPVRGGGMNNRLGCWPAGSLVRGAVKHDASVKGGLMYLVQATN